MAKLKKKKGLKDVTGDGKFTFADVLKMRGVKPKKSMGYGGKVKLKYQDKGGTVDYFAGGALAAGLGQIAQMSQNPMLQGIGKLASTVGGMTPAGKAVNMAANYLPALKGLFQQRHGGYVSPKHMLRRG